MIRLKQMAFSGILLSLAATGLALAQQPPAPGAPAEGVGRSAPEGEGALPMEDDADPFLGGDALADDAGPMADDDLADGGPDEAMDAPEDGRRKNRGGRMGWMDRNEDGAIDRAEFGGRRAERLKGADKDADGALSQGEIRALVLDQIVERRARRMARRLDVNADGKVTLAEVDGLRNKQFAIMDLNDDGRIDDRELREIHRGVERHDGPHDRPRGHGRPQGDGDGDDDDRRHGGRERFEGHHGRFDGEGKRQDRYNTSQAPMSRDPE